MPYVSVDFLVFAAFFFVLYFCIPKKYQWLLLLAASIVYYLLSDWRAAAFVVVTTCTVYAAARKMDCLTAENQRILAEGEHGKEKKAAMKAELTKKKRRVLVGALLLNFGILAALKYCVFLLGAALTVFPMPVLEASLGTISLLLPLGISFYTFQAVGYLIDVYRNRYPACGSLPRFALFVTFFPQLVQGPISRYDQLAPQLTAEHAFDYTQFKYGLQLMLWGYFKKMVIGDRAAQIVAHVTADPEAYPGFLMITAILSFVVQIYADFSGGIDIARGVAQCCGITMVQNFERPHFAQSVSEYWRRWHITLGTWMKDYLLYPVSLSKAFFNFGKRARKWFGNYWGKMIPTCLAMGIVFMVVGIWHGPSLKYIIFGLYNGFWIILGIALTPKLQALNEKHHLVRTDTFSWQLFKTLGTFAIVVVSKCFVMPGSAADAVARLKLAVTVFNPWVLTDGSLYKMGLNSNEFHLLVFAILIFFTVSLLQEKGYHLRESLARQNLVARWAVYLAAAMAVIIFGVYGLGYNTADFIYQGF